MKGQDSQELLRNALIKIKELKAQLKEHEAKESEPIAVIGLACRFPAGGNGPEAFWRALDAGVDGIRRIPAERWPAEAMDEEKTALRWAGLLDTIDEFDPGFFGISPREAALLDPQQRLVLEMSWEALEHAGQTADRLMGSRTGVFLGMCSADYQQLFLAAPPYDTYGALGNMFSTAAGRISYTFGLQGPCTTIDTACSSSLTAVHLACVSLRLGESDMALAGGVNLILTPKTMKMLAALQALSPDGRCKTFDSRANGFVRGEGCGMVLLKRLSDAKRDGDQILALLKGSIVNQDGRSTGLTAPNVSSQKAMLRRVLEVARLQPEDISYVETHGTGTSLGDPIEFEALREVIGAPRADGSKCVLGAVKSNIGHMEGAAGIGGLIKAILCLQHEAIPKNLHFKTLNPRISLDGTPFVIPTETTTWKSNGKPRRAGVSSFGISGTNAHVILEEEPRREEQPLREASSYLLPLSAKTPEALSALAKSYQEWLLHTDEPLHHVAYTASLRRSHFEYRLGVVGTNKDEIAAALRAFTAGETSPSIVAGRASSSAPKVVFVFSGQGSQWIGMGRQLYQEESAFRDALAACDEAIRKEAGFSIIEELEKPADTSRLHETIVAQPALFALEVSLAALLKSWALEPSAVIGHSVGEIAAAHVAGMLDLDQAARLVSLRARVMQKATGHGQMASVSLDEQAANLAIAELQDRIGIAAVNDPHSVVLSGDVETVTTLVERLAANGTQTRALRVNYAFHSPQMEPLAAELTKILGVLKAKPGAIPMVSTVTGKPVSADQLDTTYWAQNIRQTVRFSDAVAAAAEAQAVFIEVGPHPVLAISMEQTIAKSGLESHVIPTLRREKNDREQALRALGAAHVFGASVHWKRFYSEGGRIVALPRYAWQRKRYWIENTSSATNPAPIGHPLLGSAVDKPGVEAIFESILDPQSSSWIAEHRVFGEIVIPGAALLELARAAGAQLLGTDRCQVLGLTIQSPLRFAENEKRRLHVVLEKNENGLEFRIHSQALGEDHESSRILHAQGFLRAAPADDAPRVDLDSLRKRLPMSGRPTDVYSLLSGRGVDLGPTFRGIQDVCALGDEALAQIVLPQTATVEAQHYGMHPAFLDAGLQCLVAGRGADEKTTYLPFEFGETTFYGGKHTEAWVHARWEAGAANAETTTGSVSWMDETGRVFASISHLQAKQASVEALRRAWKVESQSPPLYRLQWQPKVLPEGAAWPPGTWLLVADAPGAREPFAQKLAAAGIEYHPSSFDDAPRRILELAESNTAIAGILCFWDDSTFDVTPAWAEKMAAQALHIVQAITHAKLSPRLFLVTNRAMAASRGERVSLVQAPLWAFGRVARSEHPEIALKLVDVGARDDESWWGELASNDDEPEVVWRNGTRLVSRLSRLESSAKPGKPVVHPESTVLVTGGLGALGLHVAQWLWEEHRVAHILLVSRNAPTPEKSILLEELRASGARVTVAALDVSNASTVRELVESIPADCPLRGIVHAAGVVDDGLIVEQNAERLAKVFAPKVYGAWNLHEATRGLPLDFFVLFSSSASVVGNAGQSSYAAANGFLNALAHARRAEGLAAQSLNWGAWAQGGMATRVSDVLQSRWSRMGLEMLSSTQGLSLLNAAMTLDEAELVPMLVDLGRLEQAFDQQIPALWRALLAPKERPQPAAKGAWVEKLGRLSEQARAAAVSAGIREDVAKVMALGSPNEVPEGRPLQELGLDSLMAVEIRNAISARVGKRLPATLLFDYPTVKALEQFLLEKVLVFATPTSVVERPAPATPQPDDAIAIIGAGCRFPGGVRDVEGFWKLLEEEVDAIREVPQDRWDIDAFYDPNPDAPGKISTRWGGFLDEIDQFEPAFFGISPREALSLDPQQRLLLETTWEALERAGLPVDRLMGTDTGVYVGICGNEYQQRTMANIEEIDPYSILGTAHSAIVGRISYWLGLQGPNLAVDTACSSSLVSLHLACNAIRAGECSMAIAGGVNVILSPEGTVYFSRLKAMSPTGRCHAFSADADGYVRAEGCGIVVLKRLSAAMRDGDPILAVIRGTAINQDGRSQGLTAPNGPAQETVIRKALSAAGIRPADVDYVETHGTGTPLGDPIEVQALANVFGEGRAAEKPVVIGTVKTNIGHTEGAAGIAGLLKAALSLEHETIPSNLHFTAPNPLVSWAELPVRVANERLPWSRNGKRRIAGVSSFGFSGTNAHVVLEEAPARTEKAFPQASSYLLPLSAKTPEALLALAKSYQEWFARHDEPLYHVAYTASQRRSHLDCRLTVVGTNKDEFAAALGAFAAGEKTPHVVNGKAAPSAPRVVFIFPGQGSQWVGMGRQLLREEPSFRKALTECDAAIRKEAGFSVIDELDKPEETSRLTEIDVIQPVLFAIEVALAALWRAWGVEPSVVIGHSMGEVAAAYVAGVLSLADAAAIICRRSRLLRTVSGQGAMALVELTLPHANDALLGYENRLSVAVSNGPRSTVIAGDPIALEEVLRKLEKQGVFCRRVKVDIASHSPQMDPLRNELVDRLGRISPKEVSIPMLSTVTLERIRGDELVATYWADNLRRPVLFSAAIEKCIADAHTMFIEMSPHPILVPSVEENLRAANASGVALGSTRRAQDERQSLLASLGSLYVSGYSIAWNAFFPDGGRVIPLPTYSWQRERYWIDLEPQQALGTVQKSTNKPLLADCVFQTQWQRTKFLAEASLSGDGTWLLFGDESEFGASVASRLRTQGARVVRVIFGQHYERGDDRLYRIDATNPDHYSQVLRDVLEETGSCPGILHLGDANVRSLDSDSSEHFDCDALRLCTSAVFLVQAVTKHGFRLAPRLYLATRGALAVTESDSISLAQAPLMGLGNTIAIEHPEISCTRIDLGSTPNPLDAELLGRELAQPSREDRVVLRENARFVARFVEEKLVAAASTDATIVRPDRCYLITGGLGHMGLEFAQWLAEQGATHLALWDTRIVTEIEQNIITKLEQAGTKVVTAQVDVSRRQQVEESWRTFGNSLPDVAGIVHAAADFDDHTLLRQTAESFRRVWAPKVFGALHLHEASLKQPLDFFLLCSSAASVVGAPARANDAAADTVLEALAHVRRRLGLPAITIHWGPLADLRGQDNGLQVLRRLTHAEGALAVRHLLAHPRPHVTIAHFNAQQWVEFFPASAGLPFLGSLLTAQKAPRAAATTSDVAQRFATSTPTERLAFLEQHVLEQVGAVLRIDPARMDRTAPFQSFGMDSLMSLEVRNRLNTSLGMNESATMLFTYPNASALAAHLLAVLAPPEPQAQPLRGNAFNVGPGAEDEVIAIVGMSCRFPGGGTNPERFFDALVQGVDGVVRIPKERWDVGRTARTNPALQWAALIDDVDRFDAAFFGISPREASRLDPQQRLLLEVTWEALERAGECIEMLAGHRVGVFLGMNAMDYFCLLRDAGISDSYTMTGNMLSTAAGRVSYTFGFQGPCVTVETACSSSLVAIHLACQSLRRRESDLVVAGGVLLALDPNSLHLLGATQALSPDGRSKTFDATANGFVGGEGCGIVVLKRLSDARRAGDPILAVIRGSAVNQDGRSTGLTAPNVLSQQAMLREALVNAQVPPDTIEFVETHGTGTPLGDPIEFEALRMVLAKPRADGSKCALGALKSNIGHLGPAAGIAGFIKATLCLEQGLIPPNLHFNTLNPRLSLDGTPFVIPTETIPWKSNGKPRRAGVSAFGISGTNAHVILEEAPQEEEKPFVPASTYLLPLSAKTPQALVALAKSYHEWLKSNEVPLHHVVYTASLRRSHLDCRLSIVGKSKDEITSALGEFAAGAIPLDAATAKVEKPSPKVVFVFPGQGSQWVGMGRKLFQEEPVFREAIVMCDEAIRKEAGFSVIEELEKPRGTSRFAEIDIVQPVLFAIEVALAALWRSWGVHPAAVVGHSMGEVAAAFVAGALSLENAAAIMCRRSRLLRTISGQGAMALVELTSSEVGRALTGYEDRLSIAVSNGPRSTVIAGDPTALQEVTAKFEREGVLCQRIKADVASHSPQMDPLVAEVITTLSDVVPGPTLIPMRSTVTGEILRGDEMTAKYWADNLRNPVRFSQVIAQFIAEGNTVFLEMSPHPVLLPFIDENLQDKKVHGSVVASLRFGRDERQTMLSSLGALFTRAVAVDWTAFFPDGGRVVHVPTYPWQKHRHWFDDVSPDQSVPQQAPLAWNEVPIEGRSTWVTQFVREQVARVVRMQPDQMDDRTPLKSLGIDSLMALELRRSLENAFSIRLKATLAWQVDDVRALANHVLDLLDVPADAPIETTAAQEVRPALPVSMDPAAWIHRPRSNPSAQLRLFCLAYAGVGASRFRRWSELLPSWIEVCPIQLPGREERLHEPAFGTMAPLVDALVQVIEPYLDRPFAFFGCSVGGLIAFELAHAVRARLQKSPRHLFIAACASPDRVNPMLHDLSTLVSTEVAGPEAMETLRKLGLLADSRVADLELLSAVWPTLRADISLAFDYRYGQDAALDVPISVFGGSEDRGIGRPDLVGWAALTNKACRLYTVTGGHLFMDTSTEELVRSIESSLQRDETIEETKKMNTQRSSVTEAEQAGARGYTPLALKLYDGLVYGVTSPYFWRCPGSELLAHYNRHISNNHLDVGVGTGYMLDRVSFTSPNPRLYLFDLNPHTLEVTARRLARYQPKTLQGSALSPVPYEGEPFDSVGSNYMLHCIPGSIPEKAAVFDNLAVPLRPGGVIFGSTLLGEGIQLSKAGQFTYDHFTRKGVFQCERDNETDLRRVLEERFVDVSVRRIGNVAIFSARKRTVA